MAHRFYLTEQTGDKCEWCRKNIGPDGKGWHWELDQNTPINPHYGYRRTNVIIHIDSGEDAAAFKLAWEPEEPPEEEAC